ncbi:hypothetical protein Sjap_007578 [Stephania japonica]|uniref:Uncharacterized protein n=1 Tax=Stephania japonica TaxID=461633 RepID=A0AAP0JNG7_9MAGN
MLDKSSFSPTPQVDDQNVGEKPGSSKGKSPFISNMGKKCNSMLKSVRFSGFPGSSSKSSGSTKAQENNELLGLFNLKREGRELKPPYSKQLYPNYHQVVGPKHELPFADPSAFNLPLSDVRSHSSKDLTAELEDEDIRSVD